MAWGDDDDVATVPEAFVQVPAGRVPTTADSEVGAMTAALPDGCGGGNWLTTLADASAAAHELPRVITKFPHAAASPESCASPNG